MPVRLILDDAPLPPAEDADARGLVAVGGDLRPERLLDAYGRGIFPWYEEGLPILWHSPDPRFVLDAEHLRINRSLRKALRRAPYELRLDTDFEQVIERCAETPRPGQLGTWITDEMIEAYVELHRLGFAHSAEAWLDGRLVGGLYGVSLGGFFAGESMFAHAPDASKIAFVHVTRQVLRWGIRFIDCQVRTEHLARFGAEDWPRGRFLDLLAREVERPTRKGRWRFDEDFTWDWNEREP